MAQSIDYLFCPILIIPELAPYTREHARESRRVYLPIQSFRQRSDVLAERRRRLGVDLHRVPRQVADRSRAATLQYVQNGFEYGIHAILIGASAFAFKPISSGAGALPVRRRLRIPPAGRGCAGWRAHAPASEYNRRSPARSRP